MTSTITFSPETQREILAAIQAGEQARQFALAVGMDLSGIATTEAAPASVTPRAIAAPKPVNGTKPKAGAGSKIVDSHGDKKAVGMAMRSWATAKGLIDSTRGRLPNAVTAEWILLTRFSPAEANKWLDKAGAATRFPVPDDEGSTPAVTETPSGLPAVPVVPGTEVPEGTPITPAGTTASPFQPPVTPAPPKAAPPARRTSTRKPPATGSPTAAVRGKGRRTPVSA